MNFSEIKEKIESSKIFNDFKNQHPGAELCAGFFILDLMSNDNKRTLDYMLENKVFTFSINDNNEITLQEDKIIDLPDRPRLTKLQNLEKIRLETHELKELSEIEAKNQNINSQFNKIIAVLQNHEENNDNRLVWNLTCMLDGLTILHILIDAETKQIIKFEKRNVIDLIKKK